MAYPNGKKSWAELDLQERFDWHAQTYAWRHVRLGIPLEKGNSPVDPDGKWFDEAAIHREIAKLRPPKPADTAGEEERRKGRAICNEWAQQRGFVDFAAAERAGHTIAQVIRSIGGAKRMPGEPEAPEYDLANLQSDLGLAAKEYRPTPDQMRDARAALGIPEPEPQPQEEEKKHG